MTVKETTMVKVAERTRVQKYALPLVQAEEERRKRAVS